MVIQDDNGNITLSHGDTFAVKFELSKPLSVGDKAVLCINDGDSVVVKKEITISNSSGGILGSLIGAGSSMFNTVSANNKASQITFTVSANEMKTLDEGTYTYDMHIDFSDGRVFTTNWKRKLKIKGVAHNVNNH